MYIMEEINVLKNSKDPYHSKRGDKTEKSYIVRLLRDPRAGGRIVA